MLTAMLLVTLVSAVAEDADLTEVLLKDGQKLVGEVRGHDEMALLMIIPIGGPGVGIGGSVKRPVRWTEIETIDGLTIAEWLEERAATVEAPEARPAEDGHLLERFRSWMGSRSGMAVWQAIAAIALLVLIPSTLLHRTGRLMGMDDLDVIRSLGGGLLGFGSAWAALRIYPAWAAGIPWASVVAAAIVIWLTMRPTPLRWIVLALVEVAALAGLIALILGVSRFLP